MAEEQNQTVDVAPAVAAPVLEMKEDAAPAPQTATEESTAPEAAADAPAAEDKPAEDAAQAAETTEGGEQVKEEVKPIEEGHLGYKAQGAGFPKNLISTKTFFSFGTDAMTSEALAHYRRLEKHVEYAMHNTSWAAHTCRGLLFVGDKKTPTGIINLSDASEPELDGAKGFHLTARGSKHTFKATSVDERDSWVAMLTTKIAEAKELATTVTETDIYKQTMESFRPVPPATPAKEDKPEEAGEEAPKPEEAAAGEEAPKDEGAPAGEESKADDAKAKRRANKRTSIFGFMMREDKEDAKAEEPALPEASGAETVPESEAPATEEAPAAEEAVAATPAEDKPAEEAPASPESPNQKPKRTSIFASVFSKKEKKVTEVAKTEESPKEEAETTDSAPVIPPMEATDPLAVDVSSPEAAPAETVESPVAAGEAKKDSREKRKSSLPSFNFGKREKSPGPGSEDSKSAFSKLRATIKGSSKSAPKTEEKPAEEAVKEEAAKEGEPEAAKEEQEEGAAEGLAPAEEAPKADETEPSKEEAAAPAVPAAA